MFSSGGLVIFDLYVKVSVPSEALSERLTIKMEGSSEGRIVEIPNSAIVISGANSRVAGHNL